MMLLYKSYLFEVIPLVAFCGLDCDDGFCVANEEIVADLLSEAAALFGCPFEVNDPCFVTFGEEGSASQAELAFIVVLIGTIGQAIAIGN
eukprot:snap_masked-scaffold_22-processed-gene-0.25-mRNA-1 protein AED:1.00 eAED:1.00 QI:0/0/0/0/1/1/2/0/89